MVDAEVLSVKEKYSSLNTYGGNYKTNPLFFEIILLCIFEISHNQNFIAYLYLRVPAMVSLYGTFLVCSAMCAPLQEHIFGEKPSHLASQN